MTKSKCETELERMIAERDHWRTQAQQRAEQLELAAMEFARLRDVIATYKDDAALLGGDNGLINDLRQHRDDWRRKYKGMEAERNKLVQRYQQLEALTNPKLIENSDRLWNMSDEELAQQGKSVFKFNSETPSLRVAYMVVAASVDGEIVGQQGAGFYFGNADDLVKDVDRFQSLVWRAPMPEDFRGSRMDFYGIPFELQLQAIQMLCLYVYDPKLKQEFGEQLDQVFKTMLEPHIAPALKEKAREAFRKSAQSTYQKLGQNRAADVDLPKLPAGARGKSE